MNTDDSRCLPNDRYKGKVETNNQNRILPSYKQDLLQARKYSGFGHVMQA
jgi:hypothetical protein